MNEVYIMQKSGGCLFTDGRYILGGLQIKNGQKIISGFGGRAFENEDIIHTALREMVEELFEIHNIPEIIEEIFIHFIPRRFAENGDYTLLVYDFEDLLDFVKILKGNHLVSPLYEQFPSSIEELIFKRSITESSEIQQLALLPFDAAMLLDTNFLKDIEFVQKN